MQAYAHSWLSHNGARNQSNNLSTIKHTMAGTQECWHLHPPLLVSILIIYVYTVVSNACITHF